jgi:F-type H+-transporting ATPase subunit delta
MGLAREAGQVAAIERDLRGFADVYGADDAVLGGALSNPIITLGERRGVLDAVLARLGLSPLTGNFLRVVLDKNRMGALPDIVREFRVLADDEANRVRATVTTAFALDAGMEAEVRDSLSRTTGKNVELTTQVDPQLLGGMVARVGSIVYDASLRTRLDRIQLQIAQPVKA